MKGFDRRFACGPWRALPVPVNLADRRAGLAFQLAWTGALAILLVAGAALVSGALGEGFTDAGALRLLLEESVPVVLLGVATAVVVARGGLDLSLAAIVPLSAAIVARTGSVGLGLAAALACGVANGLLVALLRAPGWLVTGLTGVVLSAVVALLFGDRGRIPLAQSRVSWVAPDAPLLVAAAVGAAFLLWQLAPAGGAGRSRVRSALADAAPYPFAALLAGVVGLVLSAHLGVVSRGDGGASTVELALVAVLGGSFLGAGRANVIGAAVAAVGLTALRFGLVSANVSATIEHLAMLPLLAFAIALSFGAHALAARRFVRRRPEAALPPEPETRPARFDRALFHGPAPILPVPVHLTQRAWALRIEVWWSLALAVLVGLVAAFVSRASGPGTFAELGLTAIPALLLALGAAAVMARGGFDFAGPALGALAAQLAVRSGPLAALGAALAAGVVSGVLVGLARVPGWLVTVVLALSLRLVAILSVDERLVASGRTTGGRWLSTAGAVALGVAAIVALLAYQLAPGRAPDGRPAQWRERAADALPYLLSALCAAAAGLQFLGENGVTPGPLAIGGETLPALLLAGCWLGSGRANVIGVVVATGGLLLSERAVVLVGAERSASPVTVAAIGGAVLAALALLSLAASRAVHLAVGRAHARTRTQEGPVLEEVTQDHARRTAPAEQTGPHAW